jgi:hypothetical protein
MSPAENNQHRSSMKMRRIVADAAVPVLRQSL